MRIPNVRLHQVVAGLLFWDKRKQGFRGRALAQPVPELGLQMGDRLCPNPLLQDVGKFEALVPPCDVLFWRFGNATMTHHRNPIFCAATGVTIATLALDSLHTLHLGVYKDYCMAAIWALLLADIYGMKQPNRDVLVQLV